MSFPQGSYIKTGKRKQKAALNPGQELLPGKGAEPQAASCPGEAAAPGVGGWGAWGGGLRQRPDPAFSRTRPALRREAGGRGRREAAGPRPVTSLSAVLLGPRTPGAPVHHLGEHRPLPPQGPGLAALPRRPHRTHRQVGHMSPETPGLETSPDVKGGRRERSGLCPVCPENTLGTCSQGQA